MATADEVDAGVARAVEAAHRVFDDPRASVGYEPRGRREIDAAVTALADRFRAGGGTLNEIIDNARAAAEVLSDDPFQALSEIIQNADDAGASRVRIVLDAGELTVAHDGRPLTIRDAHALAAPWLTTKRDDAGAVGRFGIGLMTLNALADSFEMHGGDYHVRFGAPTLDVVPERSAPREVASATDTVLYVRLREPDQAGERLLEWARRWDDSALLFLQSVDAVEFSAGKDVRSLRLSWETVGEYPHDIAGSRTVVRYRRALSSDGRLWAVHDTDFPTPQQVKRAHKATEVTTPVAVALGLSGQSDGMLYAGLPVSAMDVPLRLSAQFDPIASRQGVATNAWNHALVPLVAELWGAAVTTLFHELPSAAWAAVPLDDSSAGGSEIVAALRESLVAVARTSVADRADLVVGGVARRVGDLAYEVVELEGRLTEDEVAQLAQLDAALPMGARDAVGRWRSVLEDWRGAGSDIASPVTVADALGLLHDRDLPAERVLALAAIALDHGLSLRLAATNCIIRADGSRTTPPRPKSLDFLVADRSGLAVVLGLGTPLHESHLADTPDARTVLTWLDATGAILRAGDRAVLDRLAVVGKSGSYLTRRLSDDQLVALRNAVEGLEHSEWSELVRNIGGAIQIEGVQFGDRGRQSIVDVRPRAAYIGRMIDKDPDSFAVAADKTPGLVWVSNRYASVLRSSLGRQGLGALRFLRLLGAETAPRIAPHPGLEKRYASSPLWGLQAWHSGALPERVRAVSALGGSYTLTDTHSPDLERVAQHIASDRKATRRRTRAAALIATLGRAWPVLGDYAEVPVASAHHGWHRRGVTRSWWVWQAATTPWLDDDTAKPRRPIDLRLRTPATLALHGEDADGYVHRFFRDARSDILDALGVAGEPSTAELCAGLAKLRDTHAPSVAADAAVFYKAIADHLGSASHTRGDLTPGQLRKAFDDCVGLVHSNLGWRKPSDVVIGRPIFGDLAAFAPAISGVERLWRTLNIRAPALRDCIDVIGAIARERAGPGPSRQTVILETFRELGRLVQQTRPNESQGRRLAKLPLWTSAGWTDKRPVFAVHDPVLAAALATLVPVWIPGGEVSQFSALLRPLRLTVVPASAGEVVGAGADADEELTGLLQSAIGLLHDDLVRNDPAMASALRLPWPEFEQFEVVVESELTVRVREVELATGPAEVPVNAKASIDHRRLFVTDGELIGRVDGGGRAIAGLFDADQRRVAQTWLAAMERAIAHHEAEGLRLAEERAAEEKRLNDELVEQQARALQEQVKTRARARKARTREVAPAIAPHPSAPAPVSAPPRQLVDPSKLRIMNPDGEIVGDPTPSPAQEARAAAAAPSAREGRCRAPAAFTPAWLHGP